MGLTPHDVRTVEDLRRVPITTNAQLEAAGVEKITAKGTDLAACVVTCTSGSTGEPFTPSGQLVSPLVLNVFLRSLDRIDQFCVIQESRDHLVVQLASNKDFPDYRREEAVKFKTFISRLDESNADRA